MLKKNRLAVKIAGRDQGVCVVLESKKGRLLVVGPSVRKRLVSPAHLEPLPGKLNVSKLSEDEIVEKLKTKEKKFRETELDFVTKTALKAKLSR